jgi:hypothetical protein
VLQASPLAWISQASLLLAWISQASLLLAWIWQASSLRFWSLSSLLPLSPRLASLFSSVRRRQGFSQGWGS